MTFLAAAGMLYLFVRLALKLVFFASQTAFFQRSLAHADYTAAAAAAVARIARRGRNHQRGARDRRILIRGGRCQLALGF